MRLDGSGVRVLVELLDRIPVRYRAMLLLATFASLRFGELAALHRGDIDLARCSVQVARSLVQMNDGKLFEDDPKSRAGRRVVSFPREIEPELRWHLERFVEPGSDSLVFVGPKGGRLRRSNFNIIWAKVRDAVGLSGLHLHDLRHTGNTMAAATGASLREQMETDGSLKPTCRTDLSARHQGPGRDDRCCSGRGVRHGQAEGHSQGPIGHPTGTEAGKGVLMVIRQLDRIGSDLGLWLGAGDGNRTRMTSLEGWGSTIELRPRDQPSRQVRR